MSKHTPAPWIAGGSSIIQGDDTIAHVQMNDASVAERRKAARLIASAPDLLVALRNLLDDAEAYGMSDSPYSGVLIEARAAIAKAKGE